MEVKRSTEEVYHSRGLSNIYDETICKSYVCKSYVHILKTFDRALSTHLTGVLRNNCLENSAKFPGGRS